VEGSPCPRGGEIFFPQRVEFRGRFQGSLFEGGPGVGGGGRAAVRVVGLVLIRTGIEGGRTGDREKGPGRGGYMA